MALRETSCIRIRHCDAIKLVSAVHLEPLLLVWLKVLHSDPACLFCGKQECRAGLKTTDILRPVSKESSHRLYHEDPVLFTDAQRAQSLCPKGACLERFPLMEVPLLQQSLLSSPSRPHCSGCF